jgi:hypothetical protein
MRTEVVKAEYRHARPFFYREPILELEYRERQVLDDDEIDIAEQIGRINDLLNFEAETEEEAARYEFMLRAAGYSPVYYEDYYAVQDHEDY